MVEASKEIKKKKNKSQCEGLKRHDSLEEAHPHLGDNQKEHQSLDIDTTEYILQVRFMLSGNGRILIGGSSMEILDTTIFTISSVD